MKPREASANSAEVRGRRRPASPQAAASRIATERRVVLPSRWISAPGWRCLAMEGVMDGVFNTRPQRPLEHEGQHGGEEALGRKEDNAEPDGHPERSLRRLPDAPTDV